MLFDWDGTLADSLQSFFDANAAVMAALGVPFDLDAYRTQYAPDWRIVYRRLGVPEDRLPEANALWHRHFEGNAGRTVALPGAQDSLARLHELGLRLGIVTAGDRSVVEPQLQAFGMDELLSVRVYAEETTAYKPDPAPLRLALERLDLVGEESRTVYVGDAPDDMRMARAARAHAVGIASLLGEPDALRRAGADVVATSVADWVDSWLGPAASLPSAARPANDRGPA